jgi:TFIIF-interacting CTD phosphatase-like protein
VDNKIYSFAFQLENGIPILDFMGDQQDSELLKIMKYLQHLAHYENLRGENEKNYQMKEIFNYNMENYI